jgi:hypothetical protein
VKRKLATVVLVSLLIAAGTLTWLRPEGFVRDEPSVAATAPMETKTSTESRHRAEAAAPPVAASTGRSDEHRAMPALPIGTQSLVVSAESFSELLETYDSHARSELEAFNRRYGGAVTFDSGAERDWLASNGYPLAEEIVEAATMPRAELQALADSGNQKAEFLYFDRLVEDLIRARENHLATGLGPETLGENREYLEAFVAVDKYRARIADNGSPFTGHALARFYEQTLNNPYAAIGALYLSGSRGDHEATRAAEELIRRYRLGDDVRDALASFSLVSRDRFNVGYQASPRPGK